MSGQRPDRIGEVEARARLLLDGSEYFYEAGLHKFGSHARAVARDVLDLAADLRVERSAREALKAEAARWEGLWRSAATDAERLKKAASR